MNTSVQTDEQGFRVRREQPTRVEAFVDAAFAATFLIAQFWLIKQPPPAAA
jgi:hypothetical protein